MDNQEAEAMLSQTLVLFEEIVHALRSSKVELGADVAKAMSSIAASVSKRQPTDMSGVIQALRALRDTPPVVKLPLQIMPAPVQFLPSPDAVYEVEVHPIVNGKQRMTIVKTSK